MDDRALAVATARTGAQIVRDLFGRVRSGDMKGTNNPVTVADRASEAAIVATLRRYRPGDAIVAEEGGGDDGAARSGAAQSGAARSGRHWIVDPLDGTVNFLHGIPQIGVSVALYDGDAPLAAAIVDTARGEVFSAAAGEGAALDGEPLAVSGVEDLRGSIVATGFPYDHDRYAADYTAVLTGVLEQVNGIRRFGSAALDLAWVAAGRYEGFWELGLAPWDSAAGILLVREAGGVVTDPWGRPATPWLPLVVAAAPQLHEPLRAIVLDRLPERLRRRDGDG
jgi:myo-inositol-1(or 4)-monophosphatase